MGGKPLTASTDKQGVSARLKALSRKRLVIYLGISALVIIVVSFVLVDVFLPPTVPDFELQVKDWQYNPSIGSFRVSGTIGIEVPAGYSYRLTFLSITDGNKTIILDPSYEGHGGTTSILFRVALWSGDPVGPDWTFLLTQRITLESKNVQLTFEYEIWHRDHDLLGEGTEVFSVNVE
jgi:hypothetical protein